MNFVFAPRISAQQGPDQEHRRARGPDKTRDERAYREDGGVERGGADEGAAQINPARDDEQRSQERDKGCVLKEGVVEQVAAVIIAEEQIQDHGDTEGEADDEFVLVVFPEVGGGRDQGQHRDQQQEDGEWNHGPYRRGAAGHGEYREHGWVLLRVLVGGGPLGVRGEPGEEPAGT